MIDLNLNFPEKRPLEPYPQFDEPKQDWGHSDIHGKLQDEERLKVYPDELDGARQFAISQKDDGDIVITEGTVRTFDLHDDAASNATYAMFPTLVTEHTFTPASSSSYGIWLKSTIGSPASTFAARHGDVGDLTADVSSQVVIHEDINYTDPTAGDLGGIVGASTGNAYCYIGKVTTDGNGDATISQDTYGPIDLPSPTYLTGVLSTSESQNILALGADGGLTADPVSTAMGNQLSWNSNGAFLKITVASGTALAVDDSTAGEPELDNTGVHSVDSQATDVDVDQTTGDVLIIDRT